MEIRVATPAEAPGCLAIYAPIVRETPTSFEEEPPDETGMAGRIEQTLQQYPWLVATDGAEVASGGAPTSAADKGVPPEETEVIRLTLTVGDHSGSESERYHLNVGRYSHQAMEFGVVETREYVFRRGMSYPITVVHAGTNREQPDYDYTAAITGSDPSVFTIEDPGGILGRHEESSPFFAAGKTATLTVHGETAVR